VLSSVPVRAAVIGHVEWVEFLRVDRLPHAGEIVHAAPVVAVPGGGGAVPAVQLARWTGGCTLYTALGDDELGHRAYDELRARGVDVHTTFRPEPQRRAITFIDRDRERTIVVIGDRLVPRASDPLPWSELATTDCVFITASDPEGVRAARQARVVVATSRAMPLLRAAAVQLDALVGSAVDPSEHYDGDLAPPPRLVVRTESARGGSYTLADGSHHRYAPSPATVHGDTYGAGDTFAAALTLALGEGAAPADAVAAAARRAIEVLAFEGPYPR
jgi:ribokinase